MCECEIGWMSECECVNEQVNDYNSSKIPRKHPGVGMSWAVAMQPVMCIYTYRSSHFYWTAALL